MNPISDQPNIKGWNWKKKSIRKMDKKNNQSQLCLTY